jgi:2-oxoglutarate dehydrogenase E1 component
MKGRDRSIASARPERFLQLCAQDNIQVANCTTPANYFHILRRQMHRDFRKPLIIMTPKSLLRHKLAVSSRGDFVGQGHFKRILSDLAPPPEGTAKRLILCSGKIAYELMEARDSLVADGSPADTEILRIEQLYPFPSEPWSTAQGTPRPRRPRLGAGRTEEQWRLELRPGSDRMLPSRGRA